MQMGKRWLYVSVSALLMLPLLGHAQTTPEDEYKNLIKISQDIQPLGPTPFGETSTCTTAR